MRKSELCISAPIVLTLRDAASLKTLRYSTIHVCSGKRYKGHKLCDTERVWFYVWSLLYSAEA